MGKRTYVRSGGTWVDVTTGAAFPASSTAPTSPTTGQVYFNTSEQKAYIWNGSSWAPFTPLTDSTSTTSSTTAASATAVKSAYDLANAALPKSGGTLTGDVTLNAQSDLRFADTDSSNWVGFQAPETVTNNIIWTLPSTGGSANQVLKTDALNVLSWGSGGERVLLASAANGTTDIVISNIPSTYSDIEIFIWGTAALNTFIESFTMSTGTIDNSTTAYAGFTQTAIATGSDTSGTYRFPRGGTNFGADGGSHNIGIIRMPDFSNKSGLNNKPRAMYGFALTPPGGASTGAFVVHSALYNPATQSAAMTGFTINRTASVAVLVYGIP